ncbi:MAG: tRNA (adenosine(37)-N6)-threonylcarbamoyltransferase complex ATPase subunit type 1 TsaE [Verrucomicrobia bacterium]|nr:tRNA (adenosine(37)-N6)-threonylcarbamoyltransferase complex ATPase subunit type 1 TsaE [Verrucomicrobiota bacterium]
MKSKFISASPEETHQIGKALGERLQAGDLVVFSGDLGSGKTTFIRGLAEGLGVQDLRGVSSPTFTYMHEYAGRLPLYHFDLYRLPNGEEFFRAGFDEFWDLSGVCCIEWSEKLEGHLPESAIRVNIAYREEGKREINVDEKKSIHSGAVHRIGV